MPSHLFRYFNAIATVEDAKDIMLRRIRLMLNKSTML